MAAGIAASTRCASWGLATNSTLRAVIGGTPEVPLAIDWGCKEALLWNGKVTLFVISEYRAGLAKVPPMYEPTLGRRDTHTRTFRAGQDSPTCGRTEGYANPSALERLLTPFVTTLYRSITGPSRRTPKTRRWRRCTWRFRTKYWIWRACSLPSNPRSRFAGSWPECRNGTAT